MEAFLNMTQNPKAIKEKIKKFVYIKKKKEICLNKNLKVLHGNKIKEDRRQIPKWEHIPQENKLSYIHELYKVCVCDVYKNRERPRNQQKRGL